MSQLLKVYIEEDALEDIILFDDEYPNLNKIFGSGNCVFYINAPQQAIEDTKQNGESNLRKFSDGHDISIDKYQSEQTIFQDLYKYGLVDVKDGRVLYIVNRSKSEAKKLQEMYGVMVQSADNIDDNVFDFEYSKDYKKGQKIAGEENGWKSILSKMTNWPPMNSLVITDDHLLDNDEKGLNVGEINMINFLNVILPTNMLKPFYITILSSAPKNKSKKIAERIIKAISEEKKSRTNKVFINVAYCNTIHRRRIISNYFVIVCDWGFKLFYPNSGKQNVIYGDNDLEIKSIFNDMKFRGDVYLKKSYSDLNDIKGILDELMMQVEGHIKDPSKNIVSSEEKMQHNILFSDL